MALVEKSPQDTDLNGVSFDIASPQGLTWMDHPLVQSSYDAFRSPRVTVKDSAAAIEAHPLCYSTNEPEPSNPLKRLYIHFKCTVFDIYAAAVIFWLHLVTFETFLVVLTSSASTTFYYYFGKITDHPDSNATFSSNMSWVLVSFAVVSPMIMQIKQAFTRRETALQMLAELKAIMCNILLANTVWDWDRGTGRETNGVSITHAKKSHMLMKGFLYDLCEVLKMPTITRGRHRFTKFGAKQANKYIPRRDLLLSRLSFTVKQFHLQTEKLKIGGLPANEASRLNQYHWFIQARLEKILNVKMYRTPQATRSFTRIFILILPLFYGPYYVYVANGTDSESTNYAFALSLSIMTSLVMIGVFNVERALEDPFTEDGLDDVRVSETFQRMHEALDLVLQ